MDIKPIAVGTAALLGTTAAVGASAYFTGIDATYRGIGNNWHRVMDGAKKSKNDGLTTMSELLLVPLLPIMITGGAAALTGFITHRVGGSDELVGGLAATTVVSTYLASNFLHDRAELFSNFGKSDKLWI